MLARLSKLAETHDDFKLYFDFNHIVDELSYHGVRKKQLAPLVFSLAHALFKYACCAVIVVNVPLTNVYSAMFRHKIFMKLARKHPPIVEHMSKVSVLEQFNR